MLVAGVDSLFKVKCLQVMHFVLEQKHHGFLSFFPKTINRMKP